LGLYLGERLERIKRNHPSVGDVRYIGLFSALEIIQNRVTKQPIDLLHPGGGFSALNGLFTFNFHNILFVVRRCALTRTS
jgi:adenosylmethionine-8-amino-7-oxononanoate aminotransferase